jgi:hypothetical protein
VDSFGGRFYIQTSSSARGKDLEAWKRTIRNYHCALYRYILRWDMGHGMALLLWISCESIILLNLE